MNETREIRTVDSFNGYVVVIEETGAGSGRFHVRVRDREGRQVNRLLNGPWSRSVANAKAIELANDVRDGLVKVRGREGWIDAFLA